MEPLIIPWLHLKVRVFVLVLLQESESLVHDSLSLIIGIMIIWQAQELVFEVCYFQNCIRVILRNLEPWKIADVRIHKKEEYIPQAFEVISPALGETLEGHDRSVVRVTTLIAEPSSLRMLPLL